jgi:hypothetical protein
VNYKIGDKAYHRKYYQQHRTKKDLYRKEWISKNQDKLHSYRLKAAGYGISKLDYDRMYQIQGGECKICKVHQTDLKKRLSVDHDHITGKVRGLLCTRCNVCLGIYEKYKQAFTNYLEGK